MRTLSLLVTCLLLSSAVNAQLIQLPKKTQTPTAPKEVPVYDNDEDAVVAVVDLFFESMRKSDATTIRNLMDPKIRMVSTYVDKQGVSQMKEGDPYEWLKAVGQKKDRVWDEQIMNTEVRIDDNLATVWCDYLFYVGNEFSHCGVDAFHLYKNQEGSWKVINITDTRRTSNCSKNPTDQINEIMDSWHLAAAQGNATVYFGQMDQDAVFLGTDGTERWDRESFRNFSKQYFDQGKAWDFKPSNRMIYFSDDGNVAWFEESLDTWMGDCRGSGVMQKTGDQWLLEHYDLSIMVPNDKVNDYLKIIGKTQN